MRGAKGGPGASCYFSDEGVIAELEVPGDVSACSTTRPGSVVIGHEPPPRHTWRAYKRDNDRASISGLPGATNILALTEHLNSVEI
jgi:hypothetical protein